jgi:hypothetical protein
LRHTWPLFIVPEKPEHGLLFYRWKENSSYYCNPDDQPAMLSYILHNQIRAFYGRVFP